jgi:hypothetical protein
MMASAKRPSVDHETAHNVLSSATNSRQASKILDVRSSSVLVTERTSGIAVIITGCDCGLHAIWERQGTYCDDRHIDLSSLVGAVDSADEITVEQEPAGEIKRITWCKERDAE